MKKYIIYMHKNKIKGRVYIAQNGWKNENKRWRNETHYEGTYFRKAIKKYGWDNFDHIILEKDLTLEEANEKEKNYIKQYNACDKTKGYNCLPGGRNPDPKKLKSIKKSKIMKQRWTSTDFRRKMSQQAKIYWDTHPEEKQKRGQTIRCVETGDIFQTYKEAGDWLRFNKL